MHAVAIVIAASALTVDYGWKTTDNGELEYIIQIEPPLLEVLKAGGTITSEIDPKVAHVRRFRVRVGHDPVPRELPASLAADKARPIQQADAPSRLAWDRASPDPNPGEATTERGLPAWPSDSTPTDSAAEAGQRAWQEEGDLSEGPRQDVVPEAAGLDPLAIQQPEAANMLDAPPALSGADSAGPPRSGGGVPAGAEGPFSPLDSFHDQTPASPGTPPDLGQTNSLSERTAGIELDPDVRGQGTDAITPLDHDVSADPAAGQPVAEHGPGAGPAINDGRADLAEPFGGRTAMQTDFSTVAPAVQADEEISSEEFGAGQTAPVVPRPSPTDTKSRGQRVDDTVDSSAESTSSDKSADTPGRGRWLPFLLTLIGLFASCGLNVYLGWITWDTYTRYQRLVSQQHRADPSRAVS